MRLRQILTVRPLLLVEVGDSVQPQPVDAKAEPKVDDFQKRLLHGRILEVQVGLMRVKAVPVVSIGGSVPRPIGNLEVLENDASFRITLGRFARRAR